MEPSKLEQLRASSNLNLALHTSINNIDATIHTWPALIYNHFKSEHVFNMNVQHGYTI